MATTLVKNVGQLVTGDVDDPLRSADSVYVEDGTITEIEATSTTADVVVDANGLTLAPGVIDAYTHPVLGGFTPRQKAQGWPESYLQCGVTTMVSAGEVHAPGRPTDVAGAKALAILTQKAYENHRPGGAKVHAGTLILNDDMTEADIEDVHREGVSRIKFLFPLDDWDRARDLATWGRERDMVSIMHTGTSSVQGQPIEFDMLDHVGPDVAAHLSGGPIPIPDEQVHRVVEETDAVLELVVGGNQRIALGVVAAAADRDELDRVQLGTDTPSGTGVVSRGMFIQMALLAGLSDVSAAEVVCTATGNASRHHRLDQGLVEEGRPGDFCLLGPSVGSEADDALEALDRGELPAVEMVLVDGVVEVETSRNMPSSPTPPTIE